MGGQTGGLGGFWDVLVPQDLFLPVSTHTHIHLAPKLFEFWQRLQGHCCRWRRVFCMPPHEGCLPEVGRHVGAAGALSHAHS